MKAIKKLIGRVKNNWYKVMGVATATFLLSPVHIYAAGSIESAANQAESGITGTLQGVLKPIVSIAVAIIGIVLIVMGERGKEGAKAKAPQMIIGIICVVFAGVIATTSVGWFN